MSPTLLLVLMIVSYIVTLLSKHTPLLAKLPKWARPVVALASGWLGAFVVLVTEGKPLGTAAIEALTGIFAGGGAVALDQVMTQGSAKEKTRQAVSAAITATDVLAAPRRQELAAAVAIADPAARANALVRFANANPPAP